MHELYFQFFDNPQLYAESLVDYHLAHLENPADLNRRGVDKTLTFWGKIFSSPFHAGIFLEKMGEKLLQDRDDRFSKIFQDVSLYSNLKVSPLALISENYDPIDFSVEQNTILWHSIPVNLKQEYFSTFFDEQNIDDIVEYWSDVCQRLHTPHYSAIKNQYVLLDQMKHGNKISLTPTASSYAQLDQMFDALIELRLKLTQEVEQLYFASAVVYFFKNISQQYKMDKSESKNLKNKYLLKYCSINGLSQDRDFVIYNSAGFLYSPENFQNVYLELRNSRYHRAKLYPVFAKVVQYIYKTKTDNLHKAKKINF